MHIKKNRYGTAKLCYGILVLQQARAGSTLGQAKLIYLALDPMRARPDHQNLALTLALLGSGQADPGAKGARPCLWTVYQGGCWW